MIYDPALHERDICVKFNHLFFLQVCQWLDKYERHGVSDHRELDCLFSSSSRLTTKKISKVHVTGPLWGNPLVSNGFPAQMARRADSVSMSWRHHAIIETVLMICLLHKTLTKRVSGTRYYHSDIHKLYFNMKCHVSNISYLWDAMSNILNFSWEISRILFQYEHNDMHYEGKIIARPSQLYNGSSCAGKTSSQYIDVIMTTMASQITIIAQVYRLSAVHCQMTRYSQRVPGYLTRYSVSANEISFDKKISQWDCVFQIRLGLQENDSPLHLVTSSGFLKA